MEKNDMFLFRKTTSRHGRSPLNLCLEDSGFLYQAAIRKWMSPIQITSSTRFHLHLKSSHLRFRSLLGFLPISSPKLEFRSETETLFGSQESVSFILGLVKFQKPMSCFLRKTILFGFSSVRIYPTTSILVGFVGNPNTFSLRWFSSSSTQQSFTVSYLINSLGFSQQSALKVSNRLNFDTCEKPEKVINLFKKYGFTQTQISRLLRGRPELLIADSERIISPKLEFFDAKGVSWPQFSKKLSQFPTVLGSSLAKQIRPSYAFLRNFIQSDEKAIKAVERYPNILVVDVEKCLVPNIDVLRGHGVPDCNIAKLVPSQPKAFTLSSDRFREVVEEVVEMGFNPERLNFVQAVLAFRCSSKSTRECKVNAFKRWGWSEEEVLKAFERHPWCMMLSEDKIFAGMDFFMNKMGLQPCLVAKYPVILSLSLKKRVIPRSSVFQALLAKGLVKKKLSLHQLFMVPDSKFLQKFVVPHEKEAPELLKLYEEKLDLSYGPEIGDKVCREVS